MRRDGRCRTDLSYVKAPATMTRAAMIVVWRWGRGPDVEIAEAEVG